MCRSQSLRTTLDLQDGEYKIYVNATVDSDIQPVMIYCNNMTSSPTEYVTLYGINYSYWGNKSASNCIGTPSLHTGNTWFNKVRVILPELKVKVNDYRFSTTDLGKPIEYGKGGDCFYHCYKGTFNVNLTLTSFRIHDNTRWKKGGYQPVMRNLQISDTREFAYAECGGRCGVCHADPLLLSPSFVSGDNKVTESEFLGTMGHGPPGFHNLAPDQMKI